MIMSRQPPEPLTHDEAWAVETLDRAIRHRVAAAVAGAGGVTHDT